MEKYRDKRKKGFRKDALYEHLIELAGSDMFPEKDWKDKDEEPTIECFCGD